MKGTKASISTKPQENTRENIYVFHNKRSDKTLAGLVMLMKEEHSG